jgi:hypothetical protein
MSSAFQHELRTLHRVSGQSPGIKTGRTLELLERHFQTIDGMLDLDCVPPGLLLLSSDFRVLGANRCFLEVFPKVDKQLVRRCFGSILPETQSGKPAQRRALIIRHAGRSGFWNRGCFL